VAYAFGKNWVVADNIAHYRLEATQQEIREIISYHKLKPHEGAVQRYFSDPVIFGPPTKNFELYSGKANSTTTLYLYTTNDSPKVHLIEYDP